MAAIGVLGYDPDTGQWSRELQPLPGRLTGLVGATIVPGVPKPIRLIWPMIRE